MGVELMTPQKKIKNNLDYLQTDISLNMRLKEQLE